MKLLIHFALVDSMLLCDQPETVLANERGRLAKGHRTEEPTMATSFEQAGTRSYGVKIALRTLVSRHRRLIVSLIILPTLALVAVGAWLVWTVIYDALGRQAASLAVVALVATTFAISREFAQRP